MYGTVFRFKASSGKADDVKKQFEEWRTTRQPGVEGAQATYLYQLDADPNAFVGVALFKNRQAYTANADSPEQDAWFKRLRANLEADPEWMDGEVTGG